jgi:lambda repressor-like predicted transcriptional regulator
VSSDGRRSTRWTPDIIARLGVESDTTIARELGVSIAAVGQARKRLGIARSPLARMEGRAWTAAEDSMLGLMTDADLAAKIGVAPKMIWERRLALGIRAWRKGPSVKPLQDLAGARFIGDFEVGMPIADIARKHGISTSGVSNALDRYLIRRARVRAGMRLTSRQRTSHAARVRQRRIARLHRRAHARADRMPK